MVYAKHAAKMNKPKSTSVAHEVSRRVMNGATDKLWRFTDFADLEPLAVAAALSRLHRKGELQRVRRGIYHRPHQTAFGASRPDPNAVADTALRRGGVEPLTTGLSQYNRLGLTTQVSGAELVRAAPRRVRSKPPALGLRVRTRKRPLDRQPGIGADERAALDALREVRAIPDADPAAVLARLKTLLATNRLDYGRLARYALVEPPRVRALLGALGEALLPEYGVAVERAGMERLRRSLNAFSRYHLPAKAERTLKHAANWRIVADPI